MGPLKRIVLYSLVAMALAIFGGWLFYNEEAANPDPLITSHEESADCQDCHRPWRGVSDDMCLQCHDFSDSSELKPYLRFHEAHKFCTKCHLEHRGVDASISIVDHTLFNPNLHCTQCHFDPHKGSFGLDCRECHRIKTWSVKGFRHPKDEDRECYRCHKPPRSHLDQRFWSKILEAHKLSTGKKLERLDVKECWRCHITHRWEHFRMEHLFEK